MQLKNFFKDKNGRVVIAQFPNTPLWVALIFVVVQRLPFPFAPSIGTWGVIVSLLYWSYLEIFFGVNTWRKFLGLLVGGFQIVHILKLVHLL